MMPQAVSESYESLVPSLEWMNELLPVSIQPYYIPRFLHVISHVLQVNDVANDRPNPEEQQKLLQEV